MARWSLAGRLLASLVPVLALCGAAELAARLFFEEPALAVGGPLGWTAAPNLDAFYVEQLPGQVDFVVTTNADGLRTGYGRERAPGRHRIVAFGESKIFGWGLTPEQSPPGELESLLGEGWEVVNAGQPGFTSEQARRLAEALIPAYRPDGIVWFAPWNDFGRHQPDRELLPIHPASLDRSWWTRNSMLLRWLGSRALRREAATTEGAVPPPSSALFAVGPLIDPGGPVAMDETHVRVPPDQRRDNIERLARIARENDAWLVIAVIPAGAEGMGRGMTSFGLEMDDAGASLGIPVINLETALDGWPESAAVLPKDRGHFNAAANRYMMHALVTEMKHAVPLPDTRMP